jgi:hypothetical protein
MTRPGEFRGQPSFVSLKVDLKVVRSSSHGTPAFGWPAKK